MVKSLGKVVSPFRPTSRKRGWDRTTTLRRQDVGTGVRIPRRIEPKDFKV